MGIKKNTVDWLTIVMSDSGGGGSEQTQRNLISQLAKNGEKCAVIMLHRSKESSWESIKNECQIIYFPFKKPLLNYFFLFPYLMFFFSHNRISYTFSSQTLINAALGLFKKIGFIRRTKVIVRESNSIFELLRGSKLLRYKTAYKIGYKGVDLIICQTEYMKSQLLQELPWLETRAKIIVIPNPINHHDVKQRSKERIPSLETEKYIVAAGRLVPAKGFDILIDTYSKIQTELNGCKLYILGNGADKDLLDKQIKTLGLEKKILLQGRVSNVYPYFKNAQLCVISSRIEGFPNVLLQMMSQNNNVVTTLSAGDIDQIKGIYTSPTKNEEKLGRAILDCFKNDNSGKRKVFDDFLTKRTVNKFIDTILIEVS